MANIFWLVRNKNHHPTTSKSKRLLFIVITRTVEQSSSLLSLCSAPISSLQQWWISPARSGSLPLFSNGLSIMQRVRVLAYCLLDLSLQPKATVQPLSINAALIFSMILGSTKYELFIYSIIWWLEIFLGSNCLVLLWIWRLNCWVYLEWSVELLAIVWCLLTCIVKTECLESMLNFYMI